MSKELLKDEEKALKQIKKDGLVRYLSKGANIDRKEIITDFAQYVGCDGVGSTSPAGLAIAISSAIKKAYGCSVQEMNEPQLISLIGVEESIAQAVKTGMAKQLPRFEIRQKIKDLINHAKQQHQIMTEW
jgi:hypothetical protein